MKHIKLFEANSNKSIKLEIEIFDENNQISKSTLYGANISINGKWFKEITGLSSKEDVIKAISDNEDLLDTIKKLK